MKIKLPAAIEKEVYFQNYESQPEIDGVFYHPLKKHRSLEGWFMEYFRLERGTVKGLPISFEARQISFSVAVPDPTERLRIERILND